VLACSNMKKLMEAELLRSHEDCAADRRLLAEVLEGSDTDDAERWNALQCLKQLPEADQVVFLLEFLEKKHLELKTLFGLLETRDAEVHALKAKLASLTTRCVNLEKQKRSRPSPVAGLGQVNRSSPATATNGVEAQVLAELGTLPPEQQAKGLRALLYAKDAEIERLSREKHELHDQFVEFHKDRLRLHAKLLQYKRSRAKAVELVDGDIECNAAEIDYWKQRHSELLEESEGLLTREAQAERSVQAQLDMNAMLTDKLEQTEAKLAEAMRQNQLTAAPPVAPDPAQFEAALTGLRVKLNEAATSLEEKETELAEAMSELKKAKVKAERERLLHTEKLKERETSRTNAIREVMAAKECNQQLVHDLKQEEECNQKLQAMLQGTSFKLYMPQAL